MKKLLLILILIPLLNCAGWRGQAKSTLAMAHQATRGMSSVTEPFYKVKCESEARKCASEGNKVCDKLTTCQDERSRMNKNIIRIHTAISLAYGFLAVGDKDKAGEIISSVLTQLGEINKLMVEEGVY